MQVIFECPVCQKRTSCRPNPADCPLQCDHCEWTRDEGKHDFEDDFCKRCRVCGCDDLWRQKDFPPALGQSIVLAGGFLSIIFWGMYLPELAIGTLMAFAFVDMLLYLFMADMLVCYRCRARHRKTNLSEEHPAFNLELSERYVQMKKRQDAAEQS